MLVFDGDCRFCRLWVERWRQVTGDAVEYLPQQDPAVSQRFPSLDRAALEEAVHLVEPGGRVTRGAEAVLRALALGPGGAPWARTCLARPWVMALAEGAYRRVARHRRGFSLVTRVLWGGTVRRPTWWMARELFLAGLAAIHLLAFLSLGVQVEGLIGSQGVLPAAEFLQRAAAFFDDAGIGGDRYRLLPTLGWLGAGDPALRAHCLAGVVLALLALSGYARAPAFFGLGVLYLSLTVMGQDFLSFQWDALLIEATGLATVLAPWRLGRRAALAAPPSRWGRALVVWLLFRLMFESGMVKLVSGDPTWRSGSALEYHYWTQPLPGPWAWHVHHLPAAVHRVSCGVMFAMELILPFAVVAPRRLRLLAFGGFSMLQGAILATGNYTFFNLLSLVLGLVLVDDETWRRWFRCSNPGKAASGRRDDRSSWGERCRRGWLAAVALLAVIVGGGQVLRLVHPQGQGFVQALEQWIAPLRVVNSYGLFAVMTTHRREIVVEGSDDGQTWREYVFRYKPGAVDRRPAQVAPHQPRLDWQMWFAALGDARGNPWFVRFCGRLLEGSEPVLGLLRENPFPDGPPRYLRARLDEYRFSTPEERRTSGAWWVREERGVYLAPLRRRAADHGAGE